MEKAALKAAPGALLGDRSPGTLGASHRAMSRPWALALCLAPAFLAWNAPRAPRVAMRAKRVEVSVYSDLA